MTKSKKQSKQITSAMQNPLVLLVVGLVLAIISYGAGSWAIDSGAIPLYAVTVIGAYISIRYILLAIVKLIRK